MAHSAFTFGPAILICLLSITGLQPNPAMAQPLAADPVDSVVRVAPMMDDFVKSAETHFRTTKHGYKQYKRMEHYLMSRLGPDGQLVNTAAKNLDSYNTYLARSSTSSRQPMVFAHNGSWDFIGPTHTEQGSSIPGLGRVNRFAFHPTDADIIFAATAGGGLWKTTDQGMTWDPLTDGVPIMNTTGVAVDFVNPDIIYLLSGDGFGTGSFSGFNEFTRASAGVYKSTDGGNLWKPTGLVFEETDLIAAYNLYMSPEDRMTLYACTEAGLMRTQDGGTSWDTIRNGLIYELEFKPGDANHIYCVDRNYCYVSDDAGDTWIDSTLIPMIDGEDGRMCISTCESNPSIVYLIASPIDTFSAADTLPDHRGLWLSANSGADFILVSTQPNLLAGSSGTEFKSQAWYDFTLECNPLDASEILVGTIGMWKSTDAGGIWTSDDGINSLYHADVHSCEVNPLDNTLYMGGDGGVFISTDFGDSYEFRSGFLGCTQYYKIATSPFYSLSTLAGAQDNGVHLRDDIETLLDRVIWGDGMESMFHPTVDTIAISSIHNGPIYLSRDTGHTFSLILPEPNGGDTAEWTTPLALDASDPDVIYVGYKPIMKSTDQGVSFSPTSADTISAHRFLENNLTNPSRLYAGDCRDCGKASIWFEMYMSPDAGASWQRIDQNPGFPSNSFVTDASVNPTNSQEVWITCGRYEFNNKVFRSINAGNTWTNETGSLPNVPVNAIIFQNTNESPSGAVYIATDIGVFYRDDNLGDWIYFSNNLPRVEVTDLDIDYNGGLLRASTYGRGMWESELFTLCQPIISLNTSNQVLGHSYVHQATNQIFSTAHVDGYGSRVVYKCDNQIYLTEGFHATAANKALFRALLAPCSDGGVTDPLGSEEDEVNKE